MPRRRPRPGFTPDWLVCAHVLGHLCLADRRSLYAWLGTHLAAGGVGLLTGVPAASGSDRQDEVP